MSEEEIKEIIHKIDDVIEDIDEELANS